LHGKFKKKNDEGAKADVKAITKDIKEAEL
jgi:hypothetical protein